MVEKGQQGVDRETEDGKEEKQQPSALAQVLGVSTLVLPSVWDFLACHRVHKRVDFQIDFPYHASCYLAVGITKDTASLPLFLLSPSPPTAPSAGQLMNSHRCTPVKLPIYVRVHFTVRL